MFRKFISLTLMAALAFALAACNGDKNDSANSENKDDSSTQSDDGSTSSDSSGNSTKGMVDEDKVVANVNDEQIKGNEYNSALQQVESSFRSQGQDPSDDKVYKQAKQQAIDSVVGQELMLQDADKKGYEPSDKEIKKQYDEQMGQLEQQVGGKDKLKKAMDKQNISVDQLKKQAAMQLQLEMYLDKEAPVKVSEDEIKSAYDQYKKNTKDAGKFKDIKPGLKDQVKGQKQQPKISKLTDQLKKKGDVDIKI